MALKPSFFSIVGILAFLFFSQVLARELMVKEQDVKDFADYPLINFPNQYGPPPYGYRYQPYNYGPPPSHYPPPAYRSPPPICCEGAEKKVANANQIHGEGYAGRGGGRS